MGRRSIVRTKLPAEIAGSFVLAIWRMCHVFGGHYWRTVKRTGVNVYRQCVICGKRDGYRDPDKRTTGYQPLDRHWVHTSVWSTPGRKVTAMRTNDLQDAIGAWADRAFPQSSDWSRAIHLFRESIELIFAVEPATNPSVLASELIQEVWKAIEKERRRDRREGGHDIPTEAAHIVMILLHMAHAGRFSLEEMIIREFGDVQGRTWGMPDAQGVAESVKTD